MLGMASTTMSVQSIRQQISSAIDLFLHIARFSDGSRRVTHVTECVGIERDTVTMQDIFVFERQGVTANGRVVGRFHANGIRPNCCDAIATAGYELPGSLFQTTVEVR
jgi:pilus assembly protein CpaF